MSLKSRLGFNIKIKYIKVLEEVMEVEIDENAKRTPDSFKIELIVGDDNYVSKVLIMADLKNFSNYEKFTKEFNYELIKGNRVKVYIKKKYMLKKIKDNKYKIVIVEIKDYKLNNYDEFRNVFNKNFTKTRLDDFFFQIINFYEYNNEILKSDIFINLIIGNGFIETLDEFNETIKSFNKLPKSIKDIII